MCLEEETFCALLVEFMELELSLPRPSSVRISYSIFEKELVPELGTSSSVSQHHCWYMGRV